MLGESLYDDRLYALSKSVLSSRKHVGQITLSPHCPELKENQKRQFGQTAGPNTELRNSITFKPRIELQRAQIEVAAQPAFLLL